ncbi:MAG: hypothetical protein AAF558_15965 [Verrucomicrobiota bacterium]
MHSKGYVAVFKEALDRGAVTGIVQCWLDQYPRIEQVCPGDQAGVVTLPVTNPEAILWEKNLQFRILSGEAFTWIYLTLDRHIIETTGLPDPENTLPLDVFVELEGISEVVDQKNDRRLDELEKAGLL